MKTTDGTKELPAVFIYAMIIRFFKDQMKVHIETGHFPENRIGWIITLPPSATAEVQLMMIEAASKVKYYFK